MTTAVGNHRAPRALVIGRIVCLAALIMGTGCGDDADATSQMNNPQGGTGGLFGAGGNAGTGGDLTTGGMMGTGAAIATGGIGATGGAMGTGAMDATGGMMGTGGMDATGGMMGTGAMAGTGGTPDTGSCCADGDCICRDTPPAALSSDDGPYNTDNYSLRGVGCIYYPTDAEPPFSAVAISDGYGGSGGCGRTQTNGWGDFYASHGIVAMIIETTGGDQPRTRGTKLLAGIDGFKAENENPSSPLAGKLAGRYGTSGFSMGGGGTTYASSSNSELLSSVAIMPWGPTSNGITVPTLVTCGSSDGIASCNSHGTPLYNGLPSSTPKMKITVTSGHAGQPTSGGGMQGAWGLAFQKRYLDGDERWTDVLLSGNSDDTNIQ